MLEYIIHYLSMPGLAYFIAISTCLVVLIHVVLIISARAMSLGGTKGDPLSSYSYHFLEMREHYYELTFSAASILFFVGIYFSISFGIIQLPPKMMEFWMEYEDFILLGFILVSIIINNILDSLLVPLEVIEEDTTINLRLAGMIYMFIIFAYIKFIYKDNNYDTIITYFVTLIIGRFVYFDASVGGFIESMKGLIETLPMLILELVATAILAAYGFGTGYLLKENGVVVSLTFAHLFVIAEIFILDKIGIWSLIGGGRKRKIAAAAEQAKEEEKAGITAEYKEELKEELRQEIIEEMQEEEPAQPAVTLQPQQSEQKAETGLQPKIDLKSALKQGAEEKVSEEPKPHSRRRRVQLFTDDK